MIREKLAEKVKPAKEAGLVLIAIPTTKRKAGLKIPNMGVKNSKRSMDIKSFWDFHNDSVTGSIL